MRHRGLAAAVQPVLVLLVRDAAAGAPVDRGLPLRGVRGEVGVPVGVALSRLGGHVHAQRLELLRHQCGVLPVVGEGDGVVDRELDDLPALGPAVGEVAAVAVPAGLEGALAGVIGGACRGRPAGALQDVEDVIARGQLVGGRRGRIGDGAAGRKVVGEAAVTGQVGLLVGQDQRARGARRQLITRLAEEGEGVAVDAVADRLAHGRFVDPGGSAVAGVEVEPKRHRAARGEPGVVGLRVEVDVVGVDVRDVVAGPVQLAADQRVAGGGVGGDGRRVDLGLRGGPAPVVRVGLPLDQRACVAGEHERTGADRLGDHKLRVGGDLVGHRRLEDVGVAEDREQAGELRRLEMQSDVVARNARLRGLGRNAGGVGSRVHHRLEGGGDVGRAEGRAVIELDVLADGDLEVLAGVLERVGRRQPVVGAGRGRIQLVVFDQRLVDQGPRAHA